MIAKQDRQGVRHARDIEQKYDLGSESAALSAAAEARRIAESANSTAATAATEVINLTERVTAIEEKMPTITLADGTLTIE